MDHTNAGKEGMNLAFSVEDIVLMGEGDIVVPFFKFVVAWRRYC